MVAGRFWNGQTLYVLNSTGTVCGQAATVTPTNPPTVSLQQVSDCTNPTTTTVGVPVAFTSAGGKARLLGGGGFGTNAVSCDGFLPRVQLVACDIKIPPNPQQSDNIGTPFLEPTLRIETTPGPTFGQPIGYTETTDGTGCAETSCANGVTIPTVSAYGLPADGSTPIANTLRDVKTVFNVLWSGGVSPPAPLTVTVPPGGATPWPAAPTAADRANCVSCQDAYLAPTPAALAATLNAIFNQGAQAGEFTAQQSLTDAIFEYVDQVPTPAAVPPSPPPAPFSAFAPYNRYDALTPIKFVSSFTLPGFNGQLKAYQNVGGVPTLRWSAGDKLLINVTTGMSACPLAPNPGAVLGECSFVQLHGGATDSTIATSSAAIKRRIYTTTQNGYFGVTIGNLTGNVAPFRVPLWPPTSFSVAPADYTTQGLLDAALGLPLDTSATPAADFAALQTNYRACLGSNLPGGAAGPCTSLVPLVQMKAARREARDLILAFMAGALPSLDSGANPKRASGGSGAILYKAKSWILGESTLATPAVVGPPLDSTPDATPWVPEYTFYLQGPRTGTGQNAEGGATTPGIPPPGGAIPVQTGQGFGLNRPDKDNPAAPGNDSRPIKPVMTVVYAGTNEMLHAFRAGPNLLSASCTYTGVTPNNVPPASPTECGGDELWGFVPFDSLGVLSSRYINQPPKRLPHDYMIAASIRFNDIFVPSSTPFNVTIGGITTSLNGVWRKVIYFGRGVSGKYFTALDVTAPGTSSREALKTNGPIPLWNRGNPDTTNGIPSGPQVNGPSDFSAYATMGQTWSTPIVVFVDKTANTTTRKPGGVDFVMYVGSGYGAAGEGTTFYALDALNGDVIKSADVEAAAASFGLTRSPQPVDQAGNPYSNAIAADPAGFNPLRFKPLTSPHPSAAKTTRVYVGDVYGRLWKFLTAVPGPLVAIPAADLGVTQPVGTAASLIGLNPPPGQPPGPNPHIYLGSGNENRASGPFAIFGFRDDGDDTTTATAGTAVFPAPASPPGPSVTTFLPVVTLFTRTFDAGPVVNLSAPTPFPVFRGTVQPTTAFTSDTPARR